ncbi:hypothetical protein CP916_30920 [Pseudomonas aeruginosa]|nr:hypothetical protein APA25_13525 [Pseudomonas aeruginosa]KSR91557.1 hypothetical protein APB52_17995 [Pseudomonas aeruginosa]PCM94401.1 hypothetical protein CP916_30920 [Pseudomonas aeruginosa]PCN00799.1 hypothetical protein CP915_31400 [Pseudomonas aeruginosa]PCN07360.1 hypothetical protein CP914_31900 [Pseudomonas aeruginosa]
MDLPPKFQCAANLLKEARSEVRVIAVASNENQGLRRVKVEKSVGNLEMDNFIHPLLGHAPIVTIDAMQKISVIALIPRVIP